MQKISGMVQQKDLNILIELLNVALTQHNTQSQNKVYLYLKQVQQNPQTYYYLAYIFFSAGFEFAIRQIAGLTLKSILSKNKGILSSQCIQLIKQTLIENHQQPNTKLSTINHILISQLVNINKGTTIDYQLLIFLTQRISKDAHQPSINTIRIVLQDLRFHSENYQIWANEQFIKFMEILIQVLGQLFGTDYKVDAMKCMNLLIFPLPENLLHYLKNYIDNVLTVCLSCQKRELVQLAMQGLSAVAETKKNLISKELINYLSKIEIVDKEIRRVEANLWIQIIDGDEEDTLGDILQILVVKFIKMLEFTQEDYQNIKEDTQINCYHSYEDKNHHDNDGNDDGNDNDGNDNEQEIMKRGGQFTIRKASVMCIEKLSLNYSVELWQKSQNILSQGICSNDWKVKQQQFNMRQSIVLFIGIVGPQSLQQIKDIFDNLLQFLLQNLRIENTMLAGTVFWTLQKLGEILFSHVMFGSILKATLQCCGMKDMDSIVVQAGMSLLDEYVTQTKYNISEKDFQQILLVVTQIINVNSSGRKLFSAFRILLQIFQECSALLKDQFCAEIIQMLLNKWDLNLTNDNVLCPLIQCLVTGAENKRNVFTQYAHSIFIRSVSSFHLHNTRKPLVLRAIDLTSSILALQNPSITLQVKQNPSILSNSLQLFKSQHTEVKNFTYGLISDLITQNPNIYTNIYIVQVIQIVGASIDKTQLTSVNNGLMCLTDIVSMCDIGQQFIMEILDMAIYHLAKPNLQKIFAMNMAKAVGRNCFYCKDVNSCYEKVRPIWKNLCLGLRTHQQNKHSDIAFKGLFKICSHKINQIQYDFDLVVESFINYPNKNEELAKTFTKLLSEFRSFLNTQQWEQFLNRPIFLPGAIRKIQNILLNQAK